MQWPHILSIAVGAVLIAAALMKAREMELFVRQIKAYGFLPQTFPIRQAAWSMISFQCGLGTALVLLFRPGISFPLASLLWVGLLGLTTWAWTTGATEDCGCYGSWFKSTPGMASIENSVFFILTLLSWTGCRKIQARPKRENAYMVLGACAAGLALPILFGFPLFSTKDHHASLDFSRMEIDGLAGMDLSRGEHVVALFGTECVHCRELLPEIDELTSAPEIPPVLGLCKDSESQVRRFIHDFSPLFPVGRVGETVFWQLLAHGDTPRILLIRDGHILKAWERQVPAKEEIRAAIVHKGQATRLWKTEKKISMRGLFLEKALAAS